MSPIILRLLRVYFSVLGRGLPSRAVRQAFALFRTPPPGKAPSERARAWLAQARTTTIEASDDHPRLVVYRWETSVEIVAPRRTVLLVHGWGSRAARFRRLATALLARGFDVVALDGPGHGASEGRTTFMPTFVAALSTVGRRFGPFHGVVGHSFGGAASAIALRGASMVGQPTIDAERLVLVAAPDRVKDVLARFARMIGLRQDLVPRLWAEATSAAGPDVPPEAFSTAQILRARPLPTLVVHDRQDDEVPYTDGRAIADAIRGGALFTTDGLGHHRVVTDDAVLDQVTGFLTAPA